MSLTFDDGYEETYELTAALLRELNIRATYFIATAHVGQSLEGFQVADWDKWNQASSSGFEVGSHGLTHTKFEFQATGRKHGSSTIRETRVYLSGIRLKAFVTRRSCTSLSCFVGSP